MLGRNAQSKNPPFIRGVLATAWPPSVAGDSDSRRRRKFALRAGHLAMILMVLVAAISAPMITPGDYSSLQLATLITVALLYMLWNCHGTRDLVTLVLWDGMEAPPEFHRSRSWLVTFFALQVGLAATIFFVSDRGRVPNLAWLALLPPVAYAVFVLEWRGIVTTTLLILAIFIVSFSRWHPWLFTAYAALAFSFAILFTIVFSLLAVQAERARGEVQQLAEKLRGANQQLREYAVQAEELAVTRERNRIAREIHDSLGHYLAVVNVQIEAARALESSNPAQARAAIAKAQAFTQEGLQDIRRSLASLRATPLDNKSLPVAVQQLVSDSTEAGLPVSYELQGTPRQLTSPAELSLYRAVQEGLTNARKHAQAEHVQVILDFQAADKTSVIVRDDGLGAAPEKLNDGFGLLGLRERAHLHGGTLQVDSRPNAGFTLKLEVPG